MTSKSTIKDTMNNKNLPKNIDIVKLIIKELQEKMIKEQMNDLDRERERIFRERESQTIYFWKNETKSSN